MGRTSTSNTEVKNSKKVLDSKYTARKTGSGPGPASSGIADSIHVASRPASVNGVNGTSKAGIASSPTQPPLKKQRLSTDRDDNRTRSHFQSPVINGSHRSISGGKHTRSSKEDITKPETDEFGSQPGSRSSSRIGAPAEQELKPKQGDSINVQGPVLRNKVSSASMNDGPRAQERREADPRPKRTSESFTRSQARIGQESRQASTVPSINGISSHRGRADSEVESVEKDTPSRPSKTKRLLERFGSAVDRFNSSQEQSPNSTSPAVRNLKERHSAQTDSRNGQDGGQIHRQKSASSSDLIQPSITVHSQPSPEPRTALHSSNNLTGKKDKTEMSDNAKSEQPREKSKSLSEKDSTKVRTTFLGEKSLSQERSKSSSGKNPVQEKLNSLEKNSTQHHAPVQKSSAEVLDLGKREAGKTSRPTQTIIEKPKLLSEGSVSDEARVQKPASAMENAGELSSLHSAQSTKEQTKALSEKNLALQARVLKPVMATGVDNVGEPTNSMPAKPATEKSGLVNGRSLRVQILSQKRALASPALDNAEESQKSKPTQLTSSAEAVLQHTGAHFAVDHGTRQMAAKRVSQPPMNGVLAVQQLANNDVGRSCEMDDRIRRMALKAGKAESRKTSKPKPVERASTLTPASSTPDTSPSLVARTSNLAHPRQDLENSPFNDWPYPSTQTCHDLLKIHRHSYSTAQVNSNPQFDFTAGSSSKNHFSASPKPLDDEGPKINGFHAPSLQSKERGTNSPISANKTSTAQTPSTPPVAKPVKPAAKGKDMELFYQQRHEAKENESLLDSYVYGEKNESCRPGSALFNVPRWALPLPERPSTESMHFAHINPHIHWTWPRTEEWHRKKQEEIAARGNRKHPNNFAQAPVRQAKQKAEAAKNPIRVELPERVRNNPEWMKAIAIMDDIAADWHADQRAKWRRKKKGKEKARTDSDGDVDMTDAQDENPKGPQHKVVHGYEYMINREWIKVK